MPVLSGRAQYRPECKTEFVFERTLTPWTKSVDYPVSAGKDWMQFFVGFTAAESYAPMASHGECGHAVTTGCHTINERKET